MSNATAQQHSNSYLGNLVFVLVSLCRVSVNEIIPVYILSEPGHSGGRMGHFIFVFLKYHMY